MFNYLRYLLNKRLSCKNIYCAISFVSSVVLGFYYYFTIGTLGRECFVKRYRLVVSFVLAISFFACSFVVRSLFIKKVRLEKIFLILVIPMGICYAALLPIGRIPDESNHFARAYSIAHGSFITKIREDGDAGDYFGFQTNELLYEKNDLSYKQYFEKFDIKAESDTFFDSFSNTAQYPPIAYLPQALGIGLAEIMGLPVLWMALFGRMFNFVVWIFLVYFAIKISPFKKRSILLVALAPMMMQESISLSADPLVCGCAFLFISYISRFRFGVMQKIKKHDLLIICSLCIFISACKLIYFPICFALFLIPNECFSSKRKKTIILIAIVFLSLSITAIWLLFAFRYKINTSAGTDSRAQLSGIIHSPIQFIWIFVITIMENTYWYFSSILSGNLGFFDIPVCEFCSFAMSVMLLWALIGDNHRTNMAISERRVLWISVFCAVFLLFLAEYLTWTPVFEKRIWGVQGRYFIPMLPSLFIASNNKMRLGFKKEYKSIINVELLINSLSLINILYVHALN